MKIIYLLLLALALFGVASARPLKSMFLAAFDPIMIATETFDDSNEDDSEVGWDTDEGEEKTTAPSTPKSEITDKSNHPEAKIEFLPPQSAEDSEIQRLATEFLLIIKALKEVSKEETKEVLQIMPSK
ncbi:putative integral membrane protein [Cryptosporidium felis]|nr:putative integral membrane protein [Cryptosporidium felis]